MLIPWIQVGLQDACFLLSNMDFTDSGGFSPQFMAMFRIINMDKPSNLTFFSPECSHILSHICWFQTTAGHWHSSCLAKVQPSASLLEATEFGRGLCHKLRPWTAPFLIGSHWRSNTKIPVDTSCTLHTKVL